MAGRALVIGAGVAGAACAAGLRSADVEVTVIDKASGVGGRMSTRRVTWADPTGVEHTVAFDHGAPCFSVTRPRFRAVIARATADGCVADWRPVTHGSRSGERERCHVATPSTPALCRHLLADVPVRLGATVRRLQRTAEGLWSVAIEGAPLAGPFEHVVVSLPPAQAAVLVAGHRDDWAAALMARRMEPCWTLMAVTDDVDWPWDAAEPDRGPLAWVVRNDRMPGRSTCAGHAIWTAHATAEWSAEHLDAEPREVLEILRRALATQLPAAADPQRPVRWHHAAVHRWRHAAPSPDCDESGAFWWDESLGLGVCGDSLSGGGVEAAWHSGDELADHMAASIEFQATARHESTGSPIRPESPPTDLPLGLSSPCSAS